MVRGPQFQKRWSIEISSPRQRSYFFQTHFNIILHLRLGLPSDLSDQNLIPLEKKTASLVSVFGGAHYIKIQEEQPLT